MAKLTYLHFKKHHNIIIYYIYSNFLNQIFMLLKNLLFKFQQKISF